MLRVLALGGLLVWAHLLITPWSHFKQTMHIRGWVKHLEVMCVFVPGPNESSLGCELLLDPFFFFLFLFLLLLFFWSCGRGRTTGGWEGEIYSLLLQLWAVWTFSLSFAILLVLIGCLLLLLVCLNSTLSSVVTFTAMRSCLCTLEDGDWSALCCSCCSCCGCSGVSSSLTSQ